MDHDRLRDLPAVDRLLAHPKTQSLLTRFNREYVLQHCRDIVDELRTAIRHGDSIDSTALEDDSIVGRLVDRVAVAQEAGLTRVVNATGTVLHTNLGRALLPAAAVEAV